MKTAVAYLDGSWILNQKEAVIVSPAGSRSYIITFILIDGKKIIDVEDRY
ncbi:MAG: hypothetical protein GTN72_07100 [Candidatus Latescibacteria bacterium]|nr:hypothetical protein [Candidatus Latescibacterota bacterium]